MNGRIAEYVSEHSDIPSAYGYQGSSLQMLIDEIIVQAVQAEREACAKVADGIWHLLDVEGNDHDHVVTEPIAAAIRARNGAGRK